MEIQAELGPPRHSSQAALGFFESRALEVLFSGAAGAGKSRVGCEKIWYLARRYPGTQFAIVRKVAASTAATTEQTFWTWVADPSLITGRNRSERWVDIVGGSRIWFFGLDPDSVTGIPSKIGGFEGGAIFVDEAVELTEADWTMLLTRLRDPRMPWHQLMAATNPAGPNHWLKKRFTPPLPGQRDYFHATAADNRLLPEDYRASIAALPDTVHGRRLGKGLWVAAEGVIYTFPDSQIRTPEQSHWKRIVAGIDWGYVHAFACEIVAQSGSGRLAVLGEVYEHGRLIEDLIPTLLRLQAALHIDAFYADPSEPEYIAACQRAGLSVIPATNDVSPGIEAVATAIAAGMTIDPACRGLLDELPEYRWATERGSGGFKEQPVKEGDDACDALRYAVMGLTGHGVLLHV